MSQHANLSFAAFDIETYRNDEDDPGVSIASIFTFDFWGQHMREPQQALTFDDGLGQAMSTVMVDRFVRTLEFFVKQQKRMLISWAGSTFDFKVLRKYSTEDSLIKELCLGHIDMMLCAHQRLGYFIGLNAVAQAMGVARKYKDMKGSIIPSLWQGKDLGMTDDPRLESLLALDPFERWQTVVEYVKRDTEMTAQVYCSTMYNKRIKWLTRKGDLRIVDIPDGYYTVQECSDMPVQYPKWLVDPVRQETALAWLKEDKFSH